MTREIIDRPASGAQGADCLRAVVALAACALMLTLPGRAAAATVTVIHDPAVPPEVSAELLEFRAAPGERNALTAAGLREFGPLGSTTATDVWQIRDSGAVVSAAAPCETLDPHAAVCRLQVSLFPYYGGGDARIDLGDLDDVLESARRSPVLDFSVDGGAGNDRLIGESGSLSGGEGDDELRHIRPGGGGSLEGGPGDDQLHGTEASRLDGGGGRDAMYGGWTATDGDTEGAGGEAGPGRDRFVNIRYVSYQSRHAPISVDLRRGIGGQAGEGDVVEGVRNVIGGSGNDRLVGDQRDNMFWGGPGYDRLFGR
jgi:Ca2+-binding RTX toxin-like protein